MSLAEVFMQILRAARILAGAAFVFAVVVALTHWLVRSGQLQPFGAWPRTVRRWSDPVLQPVERRLAAAGGNPQQAPLWLLGVVVVLGLVLIELLQWLFGWILGLAAASRAGGDVLLAALLQLVFSLLMFALLVRVVSSWFGVGRYNRWVRPTYLATDWLVEPIRRRMPSMGMIDFSPLVAYLVLMLARMVVFRVLF